MLSNEAYLLPRIDEILDDLRGKKWFSKIDLRDAYHQLRVSTSSEYLTAFTLKFGCYQYHMMPFGLSMERAHFQRFKNAILQPFFADGIVSYLANIIVPSITLEKMLIYYTKY
jgi:Reverse transcriptase (RNA-dependent DNA polymerase)